MKNLTHKQSNHKIKKTLYIFLWNGLFFNFKNSILGVDFYSIYNYFIIP